VNILPKCWFVAMAAAYRFRVFDRLLGLQDLTGPQHPRWRQARMGASRPNLSPNTRPVTSS